MKTPTAVLLLQIVTSFVSTASQQCRNTGDSHHGLVVLDYVYKSFKVDRLATCYSPCNVEPACQSLNYDLADKTCEFSSVFKNIEDLTEKLTSVYAVNPDGDPWMRLNTQMLHVCFGTRDNHFGRFWIPVSGSLVAVKPVHVSGTVSCYTPNEASWSFRGCDESIYTVITNSSDYMIIFCSHKASNLQVPSGQEWRVWYNEDLSDGTEYDNGGLSCADVYA